METLFLLLEYSEEIHPDDQFMQDERFQRLKDLCNLCVIFVNDLYSFEKEYVEQNEDMSKMVVNIVGFHVLKYKCSISEAMERSLVVIRDYERQYNELAEALCKEYGSRDSANKFIKALTDLNGEDILLDFNLQQRKSFLAGWKSYCKANATENELVVKQVLDFDEICRKINFFFKMATGTNLPNIKPLDSSELEKERPKWKQTFLLFLKAAKRNDDSEEDKLSTLLYSIGEHGRAIFNVLFPNDGSLDIMFTKPVEQSVPGTEGGEEKVIVPVKITLKEVIEAFDRHCSPAKSTTMEAFKFNSMVQKEKQSFVEFETKLRTQIQCCAFDCSKCKTSYADRMLLDRIVTGVYDKKLQLRLLDGETKSLAQIISMSKSFEAASKNKQILEKNNVGPAEIKSIEVNEVDSNKVDAIKRLSCFNCGRVFNDQHRRVCPARNIKCRSCDKVGHFEKYCKTKPLQDQADHALKVGSLRNVKIVSNNLSVGRIRWYKIVTIQDCKIKFKIDTGSDPNCINIGFIKKINVPIEEVSEVSDLVLDYSSNEVKVFDDVFEPILGLETCIKFGIVKRIDTIEEFPTDSVEFVKRNKDIFDGLGTIPGKCSIVLKENSTPTLHYKKRFPLSVHEKLKCELEALERDVFLSDYSCRDRFPLQHYRKLVAKFWVKPVKVN
ncbi:hypothetical protein Bhyg_12595 [Pseudolycoriella hygida]|uniref:CCHC-type domain-containing protein n=1 Tax=Pseudolycoriella hygida TaxID=35572 RepID=A0A9Q0MXN4_9DIPT|nr:hypothetical protein Bhyg_12595 [Pseudolycoriella hygida]